MMQSQLDQTNQIVSCGDVSSHIYFHDLREINLSHFDKELEEIWLSNLMAHRQKNLNRDEHTADFPSKYVDAHFIGFSVMRFILFTSSFIFSGFELGSLTLENLEKVIKDSLRTPSQTLNVWRMYWSSKMNQYFLSELTLHEKYTFDFNFMSSTRRLLEKFDTLFPLQLGSLLNEHTMKFLRVLFRLLKLARRRDLDFFSFFRLNESCEDMDFFYERASQDSSFDNEIVNYVSLSYESALTCKTKIEEAREGDYIAVKVFLQTKVEVLSSLEENQEFIHRRLGSINTKIEEAKIEMRSLTHSTVSFNGMSARKVASKLLEKSKRAKELSEYVNRKNDALRILSRRLSLNEERIYIAKQYTK